MCSSSEGVRTICDPNDSVQLEAQAQLYQDILAACYIDNPGVCTAFLTWGFTDAITWLDNDGGRFYPLPFDENYEKKPAYWSMYNLLESTATDCSVEVGEARATSIILSMVSIAVLAFVNLN